MSVWECGDVRECECMSMSVYQHVKKGTVYLHIYVLLHSEAQALQGVAGDPVSSDMGDILAYCKVSRKTLL